MRLFMFPARPIPIHIQTVGISMQPWQHNGRVAFNILRLWPVGSRGLTEQAHNIEGAVLQPSKCVNTRSGHCSEVGEESEYEHHIYTRWYYSATFMLIYRTERSSLYGIFHLWARWAQGSGRFQSWWVLRRRIWARRPALGPNLLRRLRGGAPHK